MPEPNNDRKHNKRELERAKGNIAWAVQHLQVVYGTFYDAALDLANRELDIPDSYTETMTALMEASNALVLVGETVEEINKTI